MSNNQSVSDTTTNGIRVQVTTKYLPERSSPRDNEYLFAYFIRISNVGAETAQLISRHWVITNTDGEEEEVRGDGVVGEQPVLAPGAFYNYNSFCHLKTAGGHHARRIHHGDAGRRDVRGADRAVHARCTQRGQLGL